MDHPQVERPRLEQAPGPQSLPSIPILEANSLLSWGSELKDQHRIAIAEEAVALPDGLLISPQDEIASCECGDKNQQRRFRQMEVGDHGIDHLKLKWGADEQVC